MNNDHPKKSTTQQIVINKCFGGWRLSDKAIEWLIKNRGWKVTDYSDDGRGYKDETAQIVRNPEHYKHPTFSPKYYLVKDRDDELRTNKDVIAVIKTLKNDANSRYSKLTIIKIPKNVKWEIDEYDGLESIHEVHRSWK